MEMVQRGRRSRSDGSEAWMQARCWLLANAAGVCDGARYALLYLSLLFFCLLRSSSLSFCFFFWLLRIWGREVEDGVFYLFISRRQGRVGFGGLGYCRKGRGCRLGFCDLGFSLGILGGVECRELGWKRFHELGFGRGVRMGSGFEYGVSEVGG